jgi:chromosomal replication initiation ATPase DnaA
MYQMLIDLSPSEVTVRVKELLKQNISDDVFSSFFFRLEIEEISGGIANFTAPTGFLASWLSSNYHYEILDALRIVDPTITGFRIRQRSPRGYEAAKPAAQPPHVMSPQQKRPACRRAQPAPVAELPRFPRRILVEDIIQTVCRHYKVNRTDLCASHKKANIILSRQVAMYLARTLTPRSSPEIGRQFGGRDHTTVLYAASKIKRLIESDKTLAENIEILTKKLKGEDEPIEPQGGGEVVSQGVERVAL